MDRRGRCANEVATALLWVSISPCDEGAMRVTMLVRYTRRYASSRQRFFELVPRLRRHGIDATVYPFLPDDYIPGSVPRGLLGTYLRRALGVRASDRPNALFVQCECFPYFPALLEQLLLPRSLPVVLDFDDAWFHHYGHHRRWWVRQLLAGKIDRLVRSAAAVTVGSSYLEDHMRPLNPRVTLVPTSIDLDRYPLSPPVRDTEAPFTIGWIGSPSTSPNLSLVASAWTRFRRARVARLVLLGAGAITAPLGEGHRLPRGQSTEGSALGAIFLRLLPL